MALKLVRLKISIQYLNGEWEDFKSFNKPKIEEKKVLINTDFGVVAIPQEDVLQIKVTYNC